MKRIEKLKTLTDNKLAKEITKMSIGVVKKTFEAQNILLDKNVLSSVIDDLEIYLLDEVRGKDK